MKKSTAITIWEGSSQTVRHAVEVFETRWMPYTLTSRRYPLRRLIAEVIDPAVATFASSLPARQVRYLPGAEAGLSFSQILDLVGFDAAVRLHRQLLRSFLLTDSENHATDMQFAATMETLIELAWRCASKRPVKSKVRESGLNGERRHGLCRLCGQHAELAMFALGSDAPKAQDSEEEMRLSSLYCMTHRPKFPDGTWNPLYRHAKRAQAQFDIELDRLRRQSTKVATAQAISGDALIDAYVHRYVASLALQPADEEALRDHARSLVDSKISDRKKQMLALEWTGIHQSEIARRLGVRRQAVSQALATIPSRFHLVAQKRR
jgi:hypothetical protein